MDENNKHAGAENNSMTEDSIMDNPEAPQDEVEAEPSAASVEREPSTISDRPSPLEPETAESSEGDTEHLAARRPITSAPTKSAMGLSTAKKSDKNRLLLLITAGIFLFVLVGAASWWLVGGNKDTSNSHVNDISSAPIEKPKLGLAATVFDGTVEYTRASPEWQSLNATTQLQEGDSVRTGTDSRAVLTLDDGSAIRLDASTTIAIISLAADNVEIKQTEGTMYSRVSPSERTYTVTTSDASYKAMGTAFATTHKVGESGVQVFHSAVKSSASGEPISEGNQYFTVSSTAELVGAVTPIDISSLVENAFINWNVAEDEKDAVFKDNLGVLPKIKFRAEEIQKEKQAEEARIQAEREAAEKEAAQKATQEKEERAAATRTTREEMVLSYKNNRFSWTYTGKAVNGYKLVYSTTNREPTYNGKDTKSIYFSNSTETSGKLLEKGNFHVSVCAYSAGDTCIDHSNTVHVSIN